MAIWLPNLSLKPIHHYLCFIGCTFFYFLYSLMVKGCDFQHDGPQVDLGSTLKKAVIMGNIFEVSH